MPLDELYPPYQYAPGWILLAFGAIVFLLIVVSAILFFTRPLPLPKPPPSKMVTIPELREEYLQLIEAVMQRFRGGEINAREVHAELSILVRKFVNEYSGFAAPVMSLRDLSARQAHPALLSALGGYYYPSLFKKDHLVDPELGADAARKVVQQWY